MSSVNLPQAGIFVEGTRLHRYIELELPPLVQLSAAAQNAIRQFIASCVLAEQPNRQRAVYQVLAFSRDYWGVLAPAADQMPTQLQDFPGYRRADTHSGDAGAKGIAPATQRQCFIWLHSNDLDALTDAYLDISEALAVAVAVASIRYSSFSCDGFVYKDSRDLTGFIDGSANPKANPDPALANTFDDARYQAGLIPQGQPGAGGSYVLTQQWVHALAEFRQLPVSEQEQVIGRTKADSIELRGDAMPADSHVSRTDLKCDGVAQKIYRRSTAFVQGEQSGLFFLAFSTELARFEVLLNSMYGHYQRGVHDRLLHYSQPISGAYWFAPGQQALAALV